MGQAGAATVTLRLAQVDERPELEALQWRASVANPGDREVLLANPDSIDLPLVQIEAGQVLIAEMGGALAGFAVVLPRSDGEAELDGLFVEPHLWRSGVGTTLVEGGCDMARRQGASALYVIGNPHAQEFYAACRFKVIGSHVTRFGPGIRMVRRL